MLSLDLHVGRKHSGNFECTICDFEGKNEEDLNTHLHTCETFTCDYCFPKIKVKTMSDLVAHLQSKHSKHLNKYEDRT